MSQEHQSLLHRLTKLKTFHIKRLHNRIVRNLKFELRMSGKPRRKSYCSFAVCSILIDSQHEKGVSLIDTDS